MKDTAKLLEELQGFSSFSEFYDTNEKELGQTTLSEALGKLIKDKGLIKSEIVERAEMSEVYAYQILSGVKTNPKREKVLCLAVGMQLSFSETQDLLKRCGYAQLYTKNPCDAIVIYGLCKKYTLVQINELLYEYGQETLG